MPPMPDLVPVLHRILGMPTLVPRNLLPVVDVVLLIIWPWLGCMNDELLVVILWQKVSVGHHVAVLFSLRIENII